MKASRVIPRASKSKLRTARRHTVPRRRLLTESLEDRRLLAGPYAPAAGEIGSRALVNDDPSIAAWATEVVSYLPGSEVDAEFQMTANAVGPAEGTSGDVTSLGRGGEIVLGFKAPIRDGLGDDFAIFENGFSDTFLELAFVEVSSDGVNFFRFENDSLTPGPVDAFGAVDPTNVHNLAGKYRQGFGTPFDLSQLDGVSPLLDVTSITHIRLIDIFGDGNTTDTSGDPIYDPTPTTGSAGFDLDGVAVIHQAEFSSDIVDFEDVGATLSPESAYNGPDPEGVTVAGPFGDTVVLGDWHSEQLTFNNAYSLDFGSWNQWAYSNSTDTVTAGFTNQFSAYPGSGAGGSDTFGVGFFSLDEFYELPTITREPEDQRAFSSLKVTNTTYAALSMLNGDAFAKKFGGESGNDPDFLLLTIEGKDGSDTSLGTVDIYLADYRFEDNSLDYILDEWVNVDLTPLAEARSLEFAISSSDVGAFGINTPAYFAVDDIELIRPVLPVDLADSVVSEAAGVSATTVRISRPDSDTTESLEVAIASIDPSQATAPTTVTILAGERFVEFPIGVVDNELFDGDREIVIAASATGFVGSSESLLITDDDERSLMLSLAESSVTEGGSVNATVARNDADLSQPLTVTIDSTTNSLLDFDASVIIPVGQSTASFAIEAIDDDVDRNDVDSVLDASATGYQTVMQTLSVLDNDAAKLSIVLDRESYSESESAPTVGLEDVGARLAPESFYNGADGAGQFVSEGLVFNNDYNPSFGSWAGWSYSNETDTTTAGFLNQYSAFAGSGSKGSDTYGVAAAFGGSLVPKIRREPGAAPFQSIDITNTTYAALSMIQGDFFAKKFGGETGDDPDFFLLTIEGLDQNGGSLGTVEFPLADYRFADNTLDYIVDQWTTVDVSSLGNATELAFSLSSSDVGEFGMNTPAYFAIDNIITRSQQESPTFSVVRNSEDVSGDLVVLLSSSDLSEAIVPQSVVIPAGESSAEVTWSVQDDWLVDGTQTTLFTASSSGFDSGTASVNIEDDDQSVLTLTLSPGEIEENGGVLRMVLHRNVADTSTPLAVQIAASLDDQFELPAEVVIPMGQRSSAFDFNAIDNLLDDDDREVQLSASASGFTTGVATVQVIDDDMQLLLELSRESLSESDAMSTVDVENVGATIPQESFYNGADGAGGFRSGKVHFNNSYNPAFGSWGGWSASNTTDTVTPGFFNQYSAISGGGALDSPTYAVASAFPGGTVPTLTVDEGYQFKSLSLTNSTYAALSMMQGDAFAKKFGGETGDDPDFFLLTIEGIDSLGESVGSIDFYLADFRFADNELDYVVDQWTQVDVSGLVGATSLEFYLSSSDVGDFGMNTPAYFALDEVLLSGGNPDPALLTITRADENIDSELIVSLSSNDATEAMLVDEVIIPAGVASIDVSVYAVDDAIVDGTMEVILQASAPGYLTSEVALSVEDDDSLKLTATLLSDSVSEAGGDAASQLLVHRNDGNLETPLVVALTSPSDLDHDSMVTIPSGSASVIVDLSPVDNIERDGDRVVEILAEADGYPSSQASLEIVDDELSQLVVIETSGTTVVSEANGQDEVEVTLASKPVANVVVDVIFSSSDILVGETQLVFEPETWDQPQVVLFTGVPDLELEDAEQVGVVFRVNSELSDALFETTPDVGVTVTVEDYQPTQLRITEDESAVYLIDDSSGIGFEEGSHAEGLQALLNGASQSLVVEALEQTYGLLQVAMDAADDSVEIRGTRFTSIDGGEGFDRFVMNLSEDVEFVELIDGRVAAFEAYFLQSDVAATLTIDLDSLRLIGGAENPIFLHIGAGQKWMFTGNGGYGTPVMTDGQFTQVITATHGEVHVVSDTPWQNAYQVWDVNQSGDISSLDALVVINQLSRVTDPELPPINSVDDFGGDYYDVSGDGYITALDALRVINRVSREDVAEGEMVLPTVDWERTQRDFEEAAESSATAFPSMTSGSEKVVSTASANDVAISQLFSERDSGDDSEQATESDEEVVDAVSGLVFA